MRYNFLYATGSKAQYLVVSTQSAFAARRLAATDGRVPGRDIYI